MGLPRPLALSFSFFFFGGGGGGGVGRKPKKSTPTVFLKCKIFLFFFFFLSCYSCLFGVESTVASLYNFNKIKYLFSLSSLKWPTLPLFSSFSSSLFLPTSLSTSFSSSCPTTIWLKSSLPDQSHHKTQCKTQPLMGLIVGNIGGLSKSNVG